MRPLNARQQEKLTKLNVPFQWFLKWLENADRIKGNWSCDYPHCTTTSRTIRPELTHINNSLWLQGHPVYNTLYCFCSSVQQWTFRRIYRYKLWPTLDAGIWRVAVKSFITILNSSVLCLVALCSGWLSAPQCYKVTTNNCNISLISAYIQNIFRSWP